MTTTRVLFICETTTTATGAGVREVWEADSDEAAMAELGWQRIPSGERPTNESQGKLARASLWIWSGAEWLAAIVDPRCEMHDEPVGSGIEGDMIGDPTLVALLGGGPLPKANGNADIFWNGMPIKEVELGRVVDGANGHGVVRPCPVHGVRPFSLCSSCRAWGERETTR